MKTPKFKVKSLIKELKEILRQLNNSNLPFTVLEIHLFGSVLHEQKYVNDMDLLIVYNDIADSEYVKKSLYKLFFNDEQKFNILCVKKNMIKDGYIFIDSSLKSMKINSFLIWDCNNRDFVKNIESIDNKKKYQYVKRELNDFLEDIYYLMKNKDLPEKISRLSPVLNDSYSQLIVKLLKAKKILKEFKSEYRNT